MVSDPHGLYVGDEAFEDQDLGFLIIRVPALPGSHFHQHSIQALCARFHDAMEQTRCLFRPAIELRLGLVEALSKAGFEAINLPVDFLDPNLTGDVSRAVTYLAQGDRG